MKVLITGGTGSVGKILVPMLLDKNYDLTLTTLEMNKRRFLKILNGQIKLNLLRLIIG